MLRKAPRARSFGVVFAQQQHPITVLRLIARAKYLSAANPRYAVVCVVKPHVMAGRIRAVKGGHQEQANVSSEDTLQSLSIYLVCALAKAEHVVANAKRIAIAQRDRVVDWYVADEHGGRVLQGCHGDNAAFDQREETMLRMNGRALQLNSSHTRTLVRQARTNLNASATRLGSYLCDARRYGDGISVHFLAT